MTLAEFQRCIADREAEGIEFKPALLSRKEIAEYAVGIGNAGGGHLIMGVTNKPPRQVQPVAPPSADEIQQIRRSVYDSAQIHIQVENLPASAGNVVIATIPARPRGQVFHTRDGKYLIRLGEDLRGLTLAELDAIRQETVFELTAQSVPGDWKDLLRPAGMEDLRALMAEARAEADLLKLGDQDLLRALGVLAPDGPLLAAGLLLVGRSEEIQRRFPNAQWSFFRMVSDTDYDQVERGHDCFAVALRRFRELVNANNPIVTIKGELAHAEIPRYPHLAVRELLVNALVHRDYAVSGGVTLKLYPHRLELSNPGGFLGDITPANILHHPSMPRYGVFFGALARIRVANASNLGVPRVFRDLLSEGKEPPDYTTTGQTVTVTVFGQDARREFITLTRQHPDLTVDELLVIHHLTRHREISARQTAELCQRSVAGARELLARLANRERLVEIGGPAGRGRYYRLTQAAYIQLGEALAYHVDARLSQENVKGRILTALAKGPLSNAQIREITQLGRYQVVATMRELQTEHSVVLTRKGRFSLWNLAPLQESV
ncbi:MAG: ATP-binding protein [Verrucomicrobiota bacterium]